MNKYLLRSKWRCLKHRLQDKLDSLSFGKKALFCVISASVVLFIGLYLHHQYVLRFDSTENLEALYYRYQSDFTGAQKELCGLSKYEQENTEPNDSVEYFYTQTLISTTKPKNDEQDIRPSWACIKEIEGLWICSPIPFTDDEYKKIYRAVWPLYKKTPLNLIVISPDRDFIDFVIYYKNNRWSFVCDCIYFDKSNTNIDSEIEYYRTKHFMTYGVGIPDEIAVIDEHWFAETSHKKHW